MQVKNYLHSRTMLSNALFTLRLCTHSLVYYLLWIHANFHLLTTASWPSHLWCTAAHPHIHRHQRTTWMNPPESTLVVSFRRRHVHVRSNVSPWLPIRQFHTTVWNLFRQWVCDVGQLTALYLDDEKRTENGLVHDGRSYKINFHYKLMK